MEYFWRHGYCSSAMDELVRELGISRSSLYSTWHGKDDLFRAAFERYIQTIGMEALVPLVASSPTQPENGQAPRAVIESVFHTIARQVARDPWKRGCLMVNTIIELSSVAPHLAEIAHRARARVTKMFRDALEPLVQTGERSSEWADISAEFLLTLFMGLRVLARGVVTQEQAEEVARVGLNAVFG